jgi:small subunit ribosomal protein S2
MLPYIFAEKKGIHIIDLNKTAEKMMEAAAAMRHLAKSGKKVLFVATKKQGKDIVKEAAQSCGMPFVTERWLGGMLTNYATIRKSVKKMQMIEKMFADGTVKNITKKERLMLSRQKDKLEKVLGGIESLSRTPNAVFVVDLNHEHIAIKECHKLHITTFGICDTNSDPNQVDFAIPGNDDASKSIEFIAKYMAAAINEGLEDRKNMKEEDIAAEAAIEDAENPDLDAEVVVEEGGDKDGKGGERKRIQRKK